MIISGLLTKVLLQRTGNNKCWHLVASLVQNQIYIFPSYECQNFKEFIFAAITIIRIHSGK